MGRSSWLWSPPFEERDRAEFRGQDRLPDSAGGFRQYGKAISRAGGYPAPVEWCRELSRTPRPCGSPLSGAGGQ